MNIFAIIAATLTPMVMGFIYYNPSLMGGAWMRANGFSKENMKAPQPILYLLALLMSFFLSFFLWAWTTGAGGTDGGLQTTAPDGHSYVTFGHGAVHGILFSVMVLMPIFVTMKVFEQRKWAWAFVNIGYWALTATIMCGILSAWR